MGRVGDVGSDTGTVEGPVDENAGVGGRGGGCWTGGGC